MIKKGRFVKKPWYHPHLLYTFGIQPSFRVDPVDFCFESFKNRDFLSFPGSLYYIMGQTDESLTCMGMCLASYYRYGSPDRGKSVFGCTTHAVFFTQTHLDEANDHRSFANLAVYCRVPSLYTAISKNHCITAYSSSTHSHTQSTHRDFC